MLLREAAGRWPAARTASIAVTGMPNAEGKGFVDYVLWGDDGKPLGVVEAKRTRRDAKVGQQQAKLYADCLERSSGSGRSIFYTNGYEHWIWDDTRYPPRAGAGLLHQGRAGAADPAPHDPQVAGRRCRSIEQIVERHYQHRAIRRIGEAFEATTSARRWS